MADTFRSCYDEARRLILQESDLDGAIRRLCMALPHSQPDCWLWTDLLAAALFARRQYCCCLCVLRSYDCRYPDDPRARFAIQIITTRFLPARCEAEDRHGL